MFKQKVSGDSKPFTIQHSTSTTSGSSRTVHCLVLHIDAKEEGEGDEKGEEEEKMEEDGKTIKTEASHKVLLEWFSITQDSGEF